MPVQVWQIPMRQPYGQVNAGLFAGDEDRRRPVALGARPRTRLNSIVPPRPMTGAEHVVLERFHMQPLSQASVGEVFPQRVEHPAGTAGIGLALPPIRACLVKVLGKQAPGGARLAQRVLIAVVAVVEPREVAGEDRLS